jgi:hypothetical protein
MAEEVRVPIEYKYERLVDMEVKPYKNKRGKSKDENLDKAIENSMIINISEEQIIDDILRRDMEEMVLRSQEEYLEQLKKEKEEERIKSERRKNNISKFSNIRTQMKKIRRFDADIQKLSDIIEPIIDIYCEDDTKIFELDYDTYAFIIKNLKTIRLNNYDLELVKGIIKMDNSITRPRCALENMS